MFDDEIDEERFQFFCGRRVRRGFDFDGRFDDRLLNDDLFLLDIIRLNLSRLEDLLGLDAWRGRNRGTRRFDNDGRARRFLTILLNTSLGTRS